MPRTPPEFWSSSSSWSLSMLRADRGVFGIVAPGQNSIWIIAGVQPDDRLRRGLPAIVERDGGSHPHGIAALHGCAGLRGPEYRGNRVDVPGRARALLQKGA